MNDSFVSGPKVKPTQMHFVVNHWSFSAIEFSFVYDLF